MEKIIFWDFDGTLVLPNDGFCQMFVDNLSQFGVTADKNEASSFLHTVFPWLNYNLAYPNETHSWWSRFLSSLIPFYERLGIKAELYEEIGLSYKNKILNRTDYRLYDDTVSTLKECLQRGYKCYLLSNNYPELPVFLKKLGIDEFFSGYVVSGLVGYEKPRPELFEYAKGLAGCTDAIMVGDNPIADVKGAKDAGFTAVLVHNDAPSESNYTFSSLSQILDIL